MNADKMFRLGRIFRQRGDGQGRGIGSKGHALTQMNFRLLNGAALDVAVFKHRFHHQITARKGGIIRAGCDARQYRIPFSRFHTAFSHLIAQQLGRMGFAPFGGGHVAVDQNHVKSGTGRDIGNACPHKARTEHAECFQAGRGQGGAARALIECG